MTRFKQGDVIKTEGEYFAEREVLAVNGKTRSYITRFMDDGSIVETLVSVIDGNYRLKAPTPASCFRQESSGGDVGI